MRKGVSWAGLVAGPGAWATSTQLNYALAPWVCGARLEVIGVAVGLVLIAFAGAVLSWQAWRSPRPATELVSQVNGEPYNFLAGLSALVAVLFAAVIVMQGVAALVLSGCER